MLNKHLTSITLFFFSLIIILSACIDTAEQTEEDIIQAYLKTIPSDTLPQKSGLYVVDISDSTKIIGTKAPQAGDSLIIAYKGYLAANTSAVFIEFPEDAPDTIIYKSEESIAGWDEGLGHLRDSMKLQLIIPSELAYGEMRVGMILPNSPLVFEITWIGK